jgi:hypothetical protein
MELAAWVGCDACRNGESWLVGELLIDDEMAGGHVRDAKEPGRHDAKQTDVNNAK